MRRLKIGQAAAYVRGSIDLLKPGNQKIGNGLTQIVTRFVSGLIFETDDGDRVLYCRGKDDLV